MGLLLVHLESVINHYNQPEQAFINGLYVLPTVETLKVQKFISLHVSQLLLVAILLPSKEPQKKYLYTLSNLH